MIIGAILRGIKTVIDAIAKAVAWLLLAFGLWVPLLYSLIFLLVVVLFLDVPLASTATVYFTGLFISFVGALWFSMARSANKAKQRKRKKSVGYNVAEVKKKNKDVAPVEENPPQIDNQPSSQDLPTDEMPNGNQPLPNQPVQQQFYQPQQQRYYQPPPQQYYQPPQYAPNQQVQPPPQQYYQPPQYAPGSTQYAQPQERYDRPSQNEYNYRDRQGNDYANRYNERRYDRQAYDRDEYGVSRDIYGVERSEKQLSNESPRIFRLREDPNMLVYEYSDRLDYYKRTVQGNVFVRRKFKN